MAKAKNAKDCTDIRQELDKYVDAYLNRHMYDTDASWPLRKTIRLPRQTELEDNYMRIRAQNDAIRDWASRHRVKPAKRPRSSPAGLSSRKASSSTR